MGSRKFKDDGSSATETKVLGGLVHVVYRHLVSICSHLQVQAALMAASLQSSANQAS